MENFMAFWLNFPSGHEPKVLTCLPEFLILQLSELRNTGEFDSHWALHAKNTDFLLCRAFDKAIHGGTSLM